MKAYGVNNSLGPAVLIVTILGIAFLIFSNGLFYLN